MATLRKTPRSGRDVVSLQIKYWLWDDDRIHIVGDDPEIPNNGIHINVKPGTSTDTNLRELLDTLVAEAGDPVSVGEVDGLVSVMDERQRRKLARQLRESFVSDETVNPYQAKKKLLEWGIDIPEQMVYNYVQAGRIKSMGKNRILVEDLSKWADEYLARKGAGAALVPG